MRVPPGAGECKGDRLKRKLRDEDLFDFSRSGKNNQMLLPQLSQPQSQSMVVVLPLPSQ